MKVLFLLFFLSLFATANAQECDVYQDPNCFGINWEDATPKDIADINPNNTDSYKLTPLHYAARWSDNPKVIQLLIDNGGDVHDKDNNGRTPLSWAAFNNNNPEVIQLLIDNGADVHSKDNTGFTSLHWAAGYPLISGGHRPSHSQNPEVIQLLIDNGADVHAKNYDGETPLYLAVTHKDYSNDPEIIQLLIDNGADVDHKSFFGDTLIKNAIANNKIPLATANAQQCNHYEDPNCFGINWETATPKDIADIDANITASYKRTPLHYAADGMIILKSFKCLSIMAPM